MAIELSNGLAWSSQEKAKQHFRDILARYADDGIISAPADHDDLLALLERYDATVSVGQTKLGAGVRAFQRRMNRGEGWQTAGFWVLRLDDTETDFSFPTAIAGKPKAQSGEFNDACRVAVASDIKAAKARQFAEHADAEGRVECEISGVRLAEKEAHLDHTEPTFGHLVVVFRAERGWHDAIPHGVLTTPDDNQMTTTFVDPDIAEAFRQFHRERATLRVISVKENLSRAARQRSPGSAIVRV